MAHVALAIMICFTPTPQAHITAHQVRVVEYGPGVFEHVVRVRNRQGYRLKRTEGWIALPSCARIGDVVTLRVGRRTRVLTVADCSQTVDLRRHTLAHLVEVDWNSARFFGFTGEGHARGVMWSTP